MWWFVCVCMHAHVRALVLLGLYTHTGVIRGQQVLHISWFSATVHMHIISKCQAMQVSLGIFPWLFLQLNWWEVGLVPVTTPSGTQRICFFEHVKEWRALNAHCKYVFTWQVLQICAVWPLLRFHVLLSSRGWKEIKPAVMPAMWPRSWVGRDRGRCDFHCPFIPWCQCSLELQCN